MTITAKVFMSGRSQALRLPAKLRLQAKEVKVEKVGASLWIHPETPPEDNLSAWLATFYADHEPLPADFLADRNDTPPQTRDWD